MQIWVWYTSAWGNTRSRKNNFLKLVRSIPDDADIKLLLSTVYQMDGRREEAIIVLQKALEIEPDHVKILYDLG